MLRHLGFDILSLMEVHEGLGRFLCELRLQNFLLFQVHAYSVSPHRVAQREVNSILLPGLEVVELKQQPSSSSSSSGLWTCNT